MTSDQPRTPALHAMPDRADAHELHLAPFHGVHYVFRTHRDLAAVTAPPYDLIDADGAARLEAKHPHNVVRLIRSRAGDEPYQQAGELLQRWIEEGVLATENRQSLYVYEQRSGPAVLQRGLVGGVCLARPEAGIVLPHEDTMPGPITDRLQLMRATDANLEPIFLLYEGGGAASALVEEVAENREPVCVAAVEGDEHRLWQVTDPAEISRANTDLRDREALIADGHHRYATYLRYQQEQHAAGRGDGPWDQGLALLVDSTNHPPTLDAIHRVLPSLPPAESIERAGRGLRVTPLPSALDRALNDLAEASTRGPAFIVAGDNRFHLLDTPDPGALEQAMPAGRSPTWRSLPAAVLHSMLLPGVWEIDEDEPGAVAFYHDAEAACTAAERIGGTAVLLPPVAVNDVLTLARAGERVPRKSTSFGPKPRTGLVMCTLTMR